MNDGTHKLAAWLRADTLPAAADSTAAAAWQAIVAEAERTGLSGLVLEKCQANGIDVPLAVAGRLHRTATAVAANNLHLRQELVGLLRSFNEAGIPVMLLKGAALNLTIYDRPDLRPMSDLDLLVRPDNVPDTMRMLASIGCHEERPLVRRDFFPKYYYETELFTGSARPARIDLHARSLRPLRVARTLPGGALWNGAKRVSVGGAFASVPRDEVMFIHLAAHAAFHGCSRLIWLYDLKRLVDVCGESMDWDMVTRLCRQWRLSLAVRTALAEAAAQLGSFVPERVVRRLAAHPASWKDRLTLRQAPRDAAGPVSHVLVDLLCTPGLRFRLGYLMSILSPDEAHLEELYPYRHSGWTFCAHTWRWLRGAGRAMGGLASLLCAIPRAVMQVGARHPSLNGSRA